MGVCIFDTEHEITTMLASKEVIEKGGTYTTDVQRSCRTRRKAHSDSSFGHYYYRNYYFFAKLRYFSEY